MNLITETFVWLADPANQIGPDGWFARTREHIWLTLVTVGLSSLIGIPAGYVIGHTGKGRGLVIGSTGAARALPTLGILTLFALIFGVGLAAPLIALMILATPSIMAGAYAGIEAVDASTVDAARAMGFTEWQILTRVEIPLGLAHLIGGLRSAIVQVLATMTLAVYVGQGGLGRFLFLGLKTQDYPQMLAASVVIIVLAIVGELIFELLQSLVSTRFLRMSTT